MTAATEVPLQILGEEQVAKPDPDDVRMWSVTTILGVLDKPALVYWSAEETAKAAIASRRSLNTRVEEEGEEAVIKWLTGARFRKPKGERTATQLGTDFHAIAEHIAVYGTHPPGIDAELRPYVEQLDRWLQRAQPTFLAAEMPCYSTEYSHAGTCDGMMEIQGTKVIYDWKTSKKSYDKQGKKTKIYPEVGLQLAAYRWSEYAVPVPPRRWSQFSRRYYLWGRPEKDNAVPIPPVDGGIAIHVTPEHADAYIVSCDESLYERFLFVLEAAKFPFEIANTVIGDELVFEERI